MATITWRAKLDAFDVAKAELRQAIMEASNAVKAKVEVLFNLPHFVRKLFRLKTSVASRTMIDLSLEPTDCFAQFLAAIRAGEVENYIVEETAHNDAPRQLSTSCGRED